jgi:hypothetical protein
MVQLLRDHPATIALVAGVSAVIGATVTAVFTQVVHRARTRQLSKEIAMLKEMRTRRIDEFARLAPKADRVAPAAPPPMGGEADVTDRMRADRSD